MSELLKAGIAEVVLDRSGAFLLLAAIGLGGLLGTFARYRANVTDGLAQYVNHASVLYTASMLVYFNRHPVESEYVVALVACLFVASWRWLLPLHRKAAQTSSIRSRHA